MNININSKAPIIAKQKIKIDAPVIHVWSILTEINSWPSWQSAVKKAHLKTALQEGAEFKWKTGFLTVKSKIHTCEKFHLFGWTGKTIGAFAIHNWVFESEKDSTNVFVEESLQGLFPFLMKNKFKKNLEEGMAKNLKELKIASEK